MCTVFPHIVKLFLFKILKLNQIQIVAEIFHFLLNKLQSTDAAGFSNPGGLAVMWWA